MNLIAKILQVLLGLWNITGGLYMMSNYQELANTWALNSLPSFFWMALGVIQILFSVLLIVSLGKNTRKIASFSASILAAIALLGIALYSAYNGLTGMLWGLLPAILLAFVAYTKKSR